MLTNSFFEKNNLNEYVVPFSLFFKQTWVCAPLSFFFLFKNYKFKTKRMCLVDEKGFSYFNYNFKVWNFKHYENFIVKTTKATKTNFFYFSLMFLNFNYVFKTISTSLFIFNFKNLILFNNFKLKKKKNYNFLSLSAPSNFFFPLNVKFL